MFTLNAWIEKVGAELSILGGEDEEGDIGAEITVPITKTYELPMELEDGCKFFFVKHRI